MGKIRLFKFLAQIEIIGVNPFVYLPDDVLTGIFLSAGKCKGKIPVRIKIEGHEFVQTLVKYSGYWRLYLNKPMRTAAEREVGDTANFEIAYDPKQRVHPVHPKFIKALEENKEAQQIFDALTPSLQLEIIRYLSRLKTEESLDRNLSRAIAFLLGKERFIGRNHP